jgi:hypothetical protein
VTPRTLRTRELNRAVLARQLLLERSAVSPTEAVERVAGLQTQYAPSGYIGLWSRLRGFKRADLTRALEDRRVVQGTLMRATIHMVSARDYPLLAAAVRRGRREWWIRTQGRALDGVDLDRVADRVRALLADGPVRQSELFERLAADGLPRSAATSAGMLLDIVRVPPSGTWDRRRADLYGLADDWVSAQSATEPEGLAHAARRYLGAFGPALPGDLAGWAGLPISILKPALAELELRRFRDEHGRELIDLPDGVLPDAGAPAPVRFLGTWEAVLLVHARRSQVLPEHHRPRIFATRTPHSFPTFLVDGAVAGTWRYDEGRVQLEPFEPLSRRVRPELEEEADRLAAFHADG